MRLLRRLSAPVVIVGALTWLPALLGQEPGANDYLACQQAPSQTSTLTPVEAQFVSTELAAAEIATPCGCAVCQSAQCECQPTQCNCPACQAKKAADLKKAVAGAYAPLFYNNNFS